MLGVFENYPTNPVNYPCYVHFTQWFKWLSCLNNWGLGQWGDDLFLVNCVQICLFIQEIALDCYYMPWNKDREVNKNKSLSYQITRDKFSINICLKEEWMVIMTWTI